MVETKTIIAISAIAIAVIITLAVNYYFPKETADTTSGKTWQIPENNNNNACKFGTDAHGVTATLGGASLKAGGPLVLSITHNSYVVHGYRENEDPDKNQVAGIHTNKDVPENVTVKINLNQAAETNSDLGPGMVYFVVIEKPSGAPETAGGAPYRFKLYIPYNYSVTPETDGLIIGDCTVYAAP